MSRKCARLPLEEFLSANNPYDNDLNLNNEAHRLITFYQSTPTATALLNESIRELAKYGHYLTINKKQSQCHVCKMSLLNPWAFRNQPSELLHTLECSIRENIPIPDDLTIDYKNEAYRLYTFMDINWKSSMNQYDLARDGFYWTKSEDNCRCVFCHLEIRGWESNDIVSGEHQYWNPLCKFIQDKNNCGNIEIGKLSPYAKILEALHPICQKNGRETVIDEGYLHILQATGRLIIPTDKTYSDYTLLNKRQKSFDLWPKYLDKKPKDLSYAGFFYSGFGDICFCYQCGVQVSDWSKDDDPWKKHNSNCTHMLLVKGPLEDEDSSEHNPFQYASNDMQQFKTIQTNFSTTILKDTDELKHPDYEALDKRIDSYNLWPSAQKPIDLAKAGFYYNGIGDQVICFQCGGGLEDWSKNDLPWAEHAKWFSDCFYLRKNKFKAYLEISDEKYLKSL